MLTDALASVALAVDPVPWARSQMAFTLAFHIILVPLGVSWSVISAGTLLSVGPLLVAFLLFQRQFVQSFMRAGIR